MRRVCLAMFCVGLAMIALVITSCSSGPTTRPIPSDYPTPAVAPTLPPPASPASSTIALPPVKPTSPSMSAPTPVPATPTPVAGGNEATTTAQVKPSVVQVLTNNSSGSGVMVDGGIITCQHVVGTHTEVIVVTSDGRRGRATVVRKDAGRDLALLATGLPLPALATQRANEQMQGQTVLVLGYPRSDVLSGDLTVTRGLLSAVRQDRANDRVLLQTDAAVNPGNSGGALVNLQGYLIGIVNQRVSNSEGLGLAIATDTVDAFINAAGGLSPMKLPHGVPPSSGVVDARSVIITSSDLGQGWVLDQTRGFQSSVDVAQAVYVWTGAGGKSAQGAMLIGNSVVVFPSESQAREYLTGASPPSGETVLNAPEDNRLYWLSTHRYDDRRIGIRMRAMVGRLYVEYVVMGEEGKPLWSLIPALVERTEAHLSGL